MTDSLRQSYLSRLNKMETEYQKAGTEGAFKVGVEGCKLIFDIAGTFGGGAYVAKGGVNLVKKVSVKIASRGLIGTTSNGYQSTKAMTILTDSQGNLITTHPRRLP